MNKAILKNLLEGIKKESYIEGYKATDEEAMGMLMSKYFEWDGLKILKATYSGLEDANFHGENKEILKMIEKLEK